MRVEVSPSPTTVRPGEPVVIVVDVFNTETIISAHKVRVIGVDENWVTVDDSGLSLFPDTGGSANVTITLPEGIPSGSRHIGIEVRELTAPQSTQLVEVELQVPAERELRMTLEQVMVTGGSTARVGVRLENGGNTDVSLAIAGTDEEEKIAFTFVPNSGVIEPGEQKIVTATLKARRRFAGSPKIRPYKLRAEGDEAPVEAYGTFVQRPFVSRGALSLLGLVLAASVFAAVITIALSQVVGKSASDRQLLLQVLRANEGGNGAGLVSSISGQVTLLTEGTPVSAVTVEAFSAQDATTPVATTVTDGSGNYKLGSLALGTYKVEFQGAGFVQVWYPAALTIDNATPVEVRKEPTTGINVRMGGLPASISGTVLGDDVAGATVTLQLPPTTGECTNSAATVGALSNGSGQIVPCGTVVTTTTVDATGVFTLTQVPSPTTYELLVTKPGSAPAVQKIDLGGGEDRKGVLLRLEAGDGSIEGTVTSGGGAVGGASVTATDGTVTLTTVSQTQEQGSLGAFALRSLATPATYTVTVTLEGFATQTVTLTLSQGQQLTGVSLTLAPGSGSIAGTVSVSNFGAGTPAEGGITVTVSDGAITLKTVTLSTGAVGTYHIEGIPVPGTYTVVFARADLATQARTIALDAFSARTVTSFDVTMQPADAIIAGKVKAKNGAGVGNVTVTLTTGEVTFEVRTATASGPGETASTAGAYEIDNIPPGTYTLSFNRQGASATSSIVTLAAGQRYDTPTYSPVLQDPAGIRGTVFVLVDGVNSHRPLAGAEVRLYLSSGFPTTVVRTATTDSNGNYHFDNLDAPDFYIVEFAFPPGSPGQKTKQVKLDESTTVTVDAAIENH